MAVITGWEFDLVKFRIPPITDRTSDIAHWLALHTADVALKDSGLDLASVDRTRAGVMLGNSLTGEFSLAHHLRLRWPYAERALRRSLQNTENGEASTCAQRPLTKGVPLPGDTAVTERLGEFPGSSG